MSRHQQQQSPAARSIHKHMAIGTLAALLLLGGFGGWALTAKLAGAVVGTGTIVVEGDVKQIQHRDGGIVGEIHVRSGDRVEAGDLLVRLDDTLTRADLDIVQKQIDQLTATRMRLIGERDEVAELAVPDGLSERSDNSAVQDLIAAERALFAARRRTIEGQKQQMHERIDQIGQETDGLLARRAAIDEELVLIGQELDSVLHLYDQGLVSFPRLAELRRMKARLAGEKGQLIAEIARAATRITETELQILQLDQDRRAEVLTELREVDARLAELAEQRIAALDQLNRVDLRSPQDGIVHDLTVHTIGGVIGAGETIMMIVPDQETLIVEARIRPVDIDQIRAGQSAILRLSAFNQRTTPELTANVRTIAANVSRDTETGDAWYVVRLEIAPEALQRLDRLTLVPGMPVEVFIQTGERTALSYLLKPLSDQIARAMREE